MISIARGIFAALAVLLVAVTMSLPAAAQQQFSGDFTISDIRRIVGDAHFAQFNNKCANFERAIGQLRYIVRTAAEVVVPEAVEAIRQLRAEGCPKGTGTATLTLPTRDTLGSTAWLGNGFSVGFSAGFTHIKTDYLGADFSTTGSAGIVCADANYDYWDQALRYAGEFSGFRIAAGIRPQEPSLFGGLTASACTGFGTTSGEFGGLPHTTKLGFLGTIGTRAGFYIPLDAKPMNATTGGLNLRSFKIYASTGFAFADVQISVPGFPGVSGMRSGTYFGAGVEATGLLGPGTLVNVPSGTVQSIDATALSIYLEYRHYALDTKDADLGGPVPTAVEFDTVMTGARIRF